MLRKYWTVLLSFILISGCRTAPPKNQLVSGISIVCLHSVKGTELAKWYHEKLGLKEDEGSEQGWHEYDFGASDFGIKETPEPRNKWQKQQVVLGFTVPDIKKAVTELQTRGVQFVTQDDGHIIYQTGGIIPTAMFLDPDGNYLLLTQPPH